MFNFVVVLVISLATCEAVVTRLTKQTAPGLTEDMLAQQMTMRVYCGPNDLVFRCFQLSGTKSYEYKDYPTKGFEGKASGYISKGECTYDGEKLMTGVLQAYITMGTCEEIKFVTVNEDGTILEAELVAPWFEVCGKEKKCKFNQKKTLQTKEKTVWRYLEHPGQGRNKGGPIWYCNKLYSCGGCTTKRLCAPLRGSTNRKFYEISSEQCSEQAPYCNYASGGCTEQADPECLNYPEKVEDEEFICMRDGYYPDPKNCNKFYTCRDKTAYAHNCPTKYTPYYHPGRKYCIASDEFCADKTSASACEKAENKGKKVPVLFTDEKLFLTCDSTWLLLDRCIGGYKFDPVKQECTFKCPHEGLFLSTEHCTKYIKCTALVLGGFKEERLECDEGKAYLEKDYACVDKSKVPNCQQTSPDFYSK